jgi:VWFA-related protein
MRQHPLLIVALNVSLLASAFAQQPTPAPVSAPGDEVVRITTNLVQMDLVVTDKKGRLVTDLRPEDFEILEDARPQQITHFAYVDNEPAAAANAPAPAPTPKDKRQTVLPPPARLRPEQVRRTIALVVDDLGLSFENVPTMRDALRKFVERQMQPNDLVAIVRTSAGMGALQQFTNDRRQLLAAIERIRWTPNSRGGVNTFASVDPNPQGGVFAERPTGRDEVIDNGTALDAVNKLREDIFTVGTLGALNFVVRGMQELPGRKSVMLFSEGFALFRESRRNERVFIALRQLVDQANRASVVVYTVDPRGLVYTGMTAADNFAGLSAQQISDRLSNRSQQLFDTQGGLIYLAQQTGGFAVRNTNDLAGGIRQVLDDQRGYYLIGYRPATATFDRRFHRLTARVTTRKGLRVRMRTGFYGIADEDLRRPKRTRAEQLSAALASPFNAGDVHLRLTPLFSHDQQSGSFIRTLMHIDARDLTFTTEADGWHKTELDVAAVAFGDNGQVLGQVGRTQTFSLREDVYRAALAGGIVYSFDVPVAKGGAYQLRMAVRDNATEHVGSASQFVEVPDLRKQRLTLSGLIVSGARAANADARPQTTSASKETGAAAAPGQDGAAPSTADTADLLAGPAIRRLRHNTLLDYACVIYNATTDKATNLPQLTLQVRLFRDGQQVFADQPQPLKLTPQPDMSRISATGRLRLGTDLTPGEYVLQLVVTDALADRKHNTAVQWSDFEIIQ